MVAYLTAARDRLAAAPDAEREAAARHLATCELRMRADAVVLAHNLLPHLGPDHEGGRPVVRRGLDLDLRLAAATDPSLRAEHRGPVIYHARVRNLEHPLPRIRPRMRDTEWPVVLQHNGARPWVDGGVLRSDHGRERRLAWRG